MIIILLDTRYTYEFKFALLVLGVFLLRSITLRTSYEYLYTAVVKCFEKREMSEDSTPTTGVGSVYTVYFLHAVLVVLKILNRQ